MTVAEAVPRKSPLPWHIETSCHHHLSAWVPLSQEELSACSLRVCKQPQLQQGRWVSDTGSKTLCLVWKHYWRAKTLVLHRKSVRIAAAACSSLAGVDVLWSWSYTVPGESCWIKQMHRHNITAIAIAQSYFMCCGLVYLKLPGVNHPTAVSAPHLLCDKEHKKQLRPLLPSQVEVMLLYSSRFTPLQEESTSGTRRAETSSLESDSVRAIPIQSVLNRQKYRTFGELRLHVNIQPFPTPESWKSTTVLQQSL